MTQNSLSWQVNSRECNKQSTSKFNKELIIDVMTNHNNPILETLKTN